MKLQRDSFEFEDLSGDSHIAKTTKRKRCYVLVMIAIFAVCGLTVGLTVLFLASKYL